MGTVAKSTTSKETVPQQADRGNKAMEYYLCKHCKSITNFAWTGHCEESQDGKHEWISGQKADSFIDRCWQNPVELGAQARTHSAS